MARNGVKFIRVHGRIIPLRERAHDGLAKGASIGTIAGYAGYAALTAATKKPQNALSNAFWGLKGAAAGGAIGALASAAIPQKRANPRSSDVKKAAKRAFAISGLSSAISSASVLAEPFVRSSKAKNILNALAIGGQGLSFSAPYFQAIVNKPGTKTVALAAGGLGAVAGTNLLRLGKPLIKYRKRLGLRRIF